MSRAERFLFTWGVAALVAAGCLAAPSTAAAAREVHWQINPHGFPGDMHIFVDVQENGAFKRDLPASAFQISVDEFAGGQGGWITNRQQVAAGWAGAQVLIMIDRSRSYTDEFDDAKRLAKTVIGYMDPKRDQMAIASFPAPGGFSESKLNVKFTNNKSTLAASVDAVKLPPKDDESGARICEALAEGLKYFPETPADRYRVVLFLSGGADKGEGKGDCVQESYAAGKVPFFNVIFELDKKYDDPRNAHKIENKAHDLAQNTGGRSLFRRSSSENKQFAGLLWNRIRSQYHLRVVFPCYYPAPRISHTSMLKVEGRDTEGIKWEATSHPAPVPEITAIYPQQAYRNHVDDGKIDLTIDGEGFCGDPGHVKAYVGGTPVSLSSQNPFRLVASLDSNVDSGKVKVINRFGQNGESPMKFEIIEPPKGSEASTTLMVLVLALVGLALIAILAVVIRSRKAKAPAAPPPSAVPPAPSGLAAKSGGSPQGEGGAPKTMAISALKRVWVVVGDDEIELEEGRNLIGREAHCAITISDVPGVSREHAAIDVETGRGTVWVEDLGSTNGTYWGAQGTAENDAQRLEQRKLLSTGDLIWVGGRKMVVMLEGSGGPQEG